MEQGYRTILWGLVFITFHINLGPVQVLPTFIGCLVIANGVEILRKFHPSKYFHRASTMAVLLAGLSFISMLMDLMTFKTVWSGYMAVGFAVGELTFCYYLFEGSSEKLMKEGRGSIAGEIRNELTTLLIFYIIFTVLECVGTALYYPLMMAIIAIFGLVLRFCVMGLVNKLRKLQLQDQDSGGSIDVRV